MNGDDSHSDEDTERKNGFLENEPRRTHRTDPTANGRKPIASGRLVPNDRGLDSSAAIAEKLGAAFNRELTAKRSQELATLYFGDIAHVVPELVTNVDIEQGTINSMKAFIEPHKNTSWIFVDDRLDSWLFTLNFLTTYRACYTTAMKIDPKLISWTERILRLGAAQNPGAEQLKLRDEVGALFIAHARILPSVNALTVSMIVFLMCHEIAHHNLDHLNQAVNPLHELEADKLAYEIFLRVADKRNELKHAQIDLSTTCAPCLMLTYFRGMTLLLNGRDDETKAHPPIFVRLEALQKLGAPGWSAASHEKHTELNRQFSILANQAS